MNRENDEITVSIVIPTLNRADSVGKALQSVLQQSVLPKEIIIVDQSDNSDTKTLVNQEFQLFLEKGISLKYIWESTRCVTYARNLGMHVSSGKFILFMDDDMIPDKNYVKEFLNVFKKNPGAIGVQGYLFPPPTLGGDYSIKAHLLNTLLKVFLLTHLEKNKHGILSSGDIKFAYPLDKIIQATIIHPSFSMFKREVILKIPQDEKLIGYSWQDEYFTLKINQLYPNSLFVTPFARVFHNAAPHGRPLGKHYYFMTAAYELYNFDVNLHPSFRNWIALFWKLLGKIIIAVLSSRSKNLRMNLVYILETWSWALTHLKQVRNAQFDGL